MSDLKTCFEQLNTDNTCRVIVLTGSGRAFSTGIRISLNVNKHSLFFSFEIPLGIDIKYLASVAVDTVEIDDIARKALLVRSMIQRLQESIRTVDKVDR